MVQLVCTDVLKEKQDSQTQTLVHEISSEHLKIFLLSVYAGVKALDFNTVVLNLHPR